MNLNEFITMLQQIQTEEGEEKSSQIIVKLLGYDDTTWYPLDEDSVGVNYTTNTLEIS